MSLKDVRFLECQRKVGLPIAVMQSRRQHNTLINKSSSAHHDGKLLLNPNVTRKDCLGYEEHPCAIPEL